MRLRSAFLAGLVAAAAASLAQAQIIREPDRVFAQPSREAMARFYPPAAKQAHVGGRVMLNCLARPSGAMSCAVLSETPARYGFGAAALRMSAAMQIGADVCASREAGACRVRFPVVFRPED